jgi:hypothetical protein
MHLICEWGISLIKSDWVGTAPVIGDNILPQEDKYFKIQQLWSNSYGVLVMIRHLIISLFLLGIALLFWLYKRRPSLKRKFLYPLICFLCVFFLIFAYCNKREALDDLKKKIEKIH